MLKRNDVIDDRAALCAKSMSGRCVELSDLLAKFSGADMRDCAARYPLDFIRVSELVSGSISLLSTLLHMIDDDLEAL